MIFWERLCLKLKETILSMWFISLKREVGAHKTSFSQPLFIEVLVPSRESELSCLLVISSLHLTTIVPLYFRTVWYSFLIIIFFYLHNHQKYIFLFILFFFLKIALDFNLQLLITPVSVFELLLRNNVPWAYVRVLKIPKS